jgi:predicted Zn-dependent protease
MNARVAIAGLIALVSIGSYCGMSQVNPVTGQKQHIDISADQERAMGLQAAPQMAQQFGGPDPDERAQALVREVGTEVQQHSSAKKSPYNIEFYLLADRKTVNAFALPGGPVFITRALFDKLQTRGELAGVLGHEIGHVVGRHSAQQMAKQRLTQGIAGAAQIGVTDPNNPRTYAAGAAVAGAAALLNLSYTRNDEKEADKFGVHFISEAGYDPRAMIGVMQILDKETGGSSRGPDFLQTHPAPANRIPLIEQEIQRTFPQGVPNGLQR